MDRNQLIERHTNLVERIARQVLVRLPPSITWDELVSAGYLGLIEAVDRYDPERNVDFSSFARSRIRGAMLDSLRDLDFVPRSVRDRINAIQRTHQKLERELGEAPDDDAIAHALGIDTERVREAKRYQLLSHTISVDEHAQNQPADQENLPILERIPDMDTLSADDALELKEDQNAIRLAFANLPERLRMLLILYYIEELTMQEIAVVMKVTIGRISQLHTAAIEHLRETLKDTTNVDHRRLALIFREAVLSEP